MRQAFADRSDLAIVNAPTIAAEPQAAADWASVSENHARAEEALSRFDYAAATGHLDAALDAARPGVTTEGGRRRFSSLHRDLAMALLVHGERGAAAEHLRTASFLTPGEPLDPARYPPELVQLGTELRNAPVDLRVTSEPTDAIATLDGRIRADDDGWFRSLPAGRHYLHVAARGFTDEVRLVFGTEQSSSTLHVTLAPAPISERRRLAFERLRLEGADAPRPARVLALSGTDADSLLVTRRVGRVFEVSAFDHRGIELHTRGLFEDESDAEPSEWLAAALPEPSDDGAWYEQWWIWTPAAVVVVGASALIVWAATRNPDVALVGGAP
jgi:hypothetical protein